MTRWKRDPRHVVKEPDEKQCNGKVRGQINVYCTKPPGHGTDHSGVGRCKWHGGASPTYDAEAHRIVANEAVATYGLPEEIDPHTALLDELSRTYGHVKWLQTEISKLEDDRVYGKVGGASGGIPEAKPHVLIEMYKDERKHYRMIAKSCIEAGIEERQVKIAEQTGQMLVQVIQGILKDLKVANKPETASIVRKHLTLASEGQLPALAAAV